MNTHIIRVDNQTFLLGLDRLYREAVKRHERSELLECAKRLCADLQVKPTARPVEGYYGEDAELTEYFLLMRALQEQPGERAGEVRETEALERLRQVTSSRLYGRMVSGPGLFPAGVDPLSEALIQTPVGEWSIPNLTSQAHEIARESDDYSLVALAALARDPVALTALRESVVLYAAAVFGAAPVKKEYVWEVDPEIATRAVKFVETFNALFDENLPSPVADNAAVYAGAAELSRVASRCVRIGYENSTGQTRHYHWAINRTTGGLVAEEFWDTEIWTTRRYADSRLPGMSLPARGPMSR